MFTPIAVPTKIPGFNTVQYKIFEGQNVVVFAVNGYL